MYSHQQRCRRIAMTMNNRQDEREIRREDLRGTWGMERLDELGEKKARERTEQAKLYGLEAAPSIVDRNLTLFRRDLYAGSVSPRGAPAWRARCSGGGSATRYRHHLSFRHPFRP